MEYKDKYLKYKNKYYDLVIQKKMEGGNPIINIPIGIAIAGIVGVLTNMLFCNNAEIKSNLDRLSDRLNIDSEDLLKLQNIINVIKKSELYQILQIINELLETSPETKSKLLEKYTPDQIATDPILKMIDNQTYLKKFLQQMSTVLQHGDMSQC